MKKDGLTAWNATEGLVGWYMMGANALRNKISTGVSNRFSPGGEMIIDEEKSEIYHGID
ncbi:MAG: hypothetical protein LBT43_18560 [Prevotella sp.]|jgi:hypothetical protein|nr:hypothetical protein [Prevotella sp.]